ncbi:DNA-3-methyladenine glycosylase I [Lewinella sp. W8]|uniref:DNA-3-methyladenine glycosylase I n=1 Tax=Lewinella sp. W8 TaxID=2528208 RepID=UPI00106811C8|nr:DNA-3-methyladenine glycosylase I [Lewinella sp. W8]MTB53761.1 DNA-3-methyladenine glycosylase I [Lewinella sp. W8]
MSTYCQYVQGLPAENPHRFYHDNEYGFPIPDDNELFGRLLLEINQAGLNWTVILNKQDNFRAAYANFDLAAVASFTEADRERLLNDAGIIRNKLKVNAAIHNAQVILDLRQAYGSFQAWLDHHHPLPKSDWVRLFKKTFKFTGGEITGEFLMSTGYLPGAHEERCPVYQRVLETNPAWNR